VIIDTNDDKDNCADPGVLGGERSHPGDGNYNDEGESLEDTQAPEKGTGNGKATKDGNGKGM
jgi:hypothetical protein